MCDAPTGSGICHAAFMPTPAAKPTLSPLICHGLIDIQSRWFHSPWCFDQNAGEQIERGGEKQSMFCEIFNNTSNKNWIFAIRFCPCVTSLFTRATRLPAGRQKKPLNGAHLDSIYPPLHFFLLLSRQPKKRDAHLPPCVHLGARESLWKSHCSALCPRTFHCLQNSAARQTKSCVQTYLCGLFFFFFFLPNPSNAAL